MQLRVVLAIAVAGAACAGCALLPYELPEHPPAAIAYPQSCEPIPPLYSEPSEPIRSITVVIKTRDAADAATCNTIWLDVGFAAWKLEGGRGGFGRNESYQAELPLPGGRYTTDDILELRFEKKGLFDLTGGLDLGGWRPETFTLYVNGHQFSEQVTVPESVKLDQNAPSWRHLWSPRLVAEERSDRGAQERLVRGLRSDQPEASNFCVELSTTFTTPWKAKGVSGWKSGPILDDPMLYAGVVGVLRTPPSPGTDNFVSLDLQVERLGIGGKWYCFDAQPNAPKRRFIRVEYFRFLGGRADDRYFDWRVGDRFFIQGTVRWDTDHEGFYEIHPLRSEDVLRLGP